jgi:hypothetical protein
MRETIALLAAAAMLLAVAIAVETSRAIARARLRRRRRLLRLCSVVAGLPEGSPENQLS